MRANGSHRSTVIAVACAALLLAGCVVAPLGTYGEGGGRWGRGGPDGAGEWVATAPPAPQYEVIGIAPLLGQVWLGGYWGWGGGRHHWVAGRWGDARPGHAWVPHAWSRGRGGWRLNPGHWRRH